MTNKPKLRFKEFDDDLIEYKLKEICEPVNRVNDGGEHPVMMLSAGQGFINQSEKYSKDNAGKSLKKYRLLYKNELAYNRGNSKLAKYGCIFELGCESALMPYVYHCFKMNEEHNSSFYGKYLNSGKMDKHLMKIVSSSARMDGLLNISAKNFFKIPIVVPSLPEQTKIAEFLSKVDELIESHEAELENLEAKKRGLMQKLLTQQIRFTDSNNTSYPDWEEKRIGKIYDERSERGGDNKELLSVTINDGIKTRSEIEGKDNSSSDKNNYKVVCKGDMVYNTMRMWQGANGISEYNGIVSPAYTVMTPKIDLCDRFMGYYFKLPELVFIFRRHSQGLTSDTWNIKYNQIKKLRINMPCKEEQEKIANVLSKMDELIEAKKSLISETKQLKKGLLQQMFV